jgi:hypothetical protein
LFPASCKSRLLPVSSRSSGSFNLPIPRTITVRLSLLPSVSSVSSRMYSVDVVLPHGELTSWEAASSGARSVPGEEGWAKGSTLVAGLPGAPMICVSTKGVCAETATLTPGSMTSRKELLHTKGAERGFRKGVGPKFGRQECGEVPGILESPTNFFSLPRSLSYTCTQDTVRVQVSCLAATRDPLQRESDENNNKIEEKPQASSRSSILGQSVPSVLHAVVSSRKKSL